MCPSHLFRHDTNVGIAGFLAASQIACGVISDTAWELSAGPPDLFHADVDSDRWLHSLESS